MELPFAARPEMQPAIKAVCEAGAIILTYYNGHYQTRIRENEPVTDADIESNKKIVQILSETNIPIISEEGEREIPDAEKYWIVDPLDGTHEFVKKTGDFNIMIALIEKNRPILGVMYCPTEKILIIAEKYKGAYETKISDTETPQSEHWKRIRVSDRKDIHYARALMSRTHLKPEEEQIIKKLNIPWATKGSALKNLEISRGNADLYFTFSKNLSIWDTAAVYCILKESGGKMTDTDGNKLLYTSIAHEQGVAATNGSMHDALIHVLQHSISTTDHN